MDLVDIDQVLDNLELREAADEQKKASATATINAQSKQLTLCNGSGASSTPPPTDVSSAVAKNFVAVSQVFNSLDDYCKNVDSLEAAAGMQKYDEECRIIDDERRSDSDLSGNKNAAATNCKSDEATAEQQQPSGAAACAIVDEQEDYDDNGDDDDDYEDEASNDIRKFCEKSNNKHDGHEAGLRNDYSSESLTTSSSSTFSSGLSPGLLCTTDEHSTPEPLAKNYVAETENLQNLHLTSSDGEMAAKQQEQQQQQHAMAENLIQQHNEDVAPVLDELAVGISTISLTTSNTQSNAYADATTATASSALENVLEDLSETTQSNSLLSQKREDVSLAAAAAQQQRAEQQEMETEAKQEDETKIMFTQGKMPNLPAALAAKCDGKQQQQVITFCSTMDEISDAELDSMLQEMDIDDVAAEEISNKTEENGVQSACNETSVINLDSAIVEQAAVPAEQCCLAAALTPNPIDSNADSFSQASTVEFSELKPQTIEVLETCGENSASIASSYSSTESDSMLDAGAVIDDADAEADEESANKRPQRPTTLDLPPFKDSRYANAGQTPPPGTAAEMHQQATATQAELEAEADTTHQLHGVQTNDIPETAGFSDPHENLGRMPPVWVPDNMANSCMQCAIKFTMIKRRHHCRACGKVLCSVCCSQKFKLQFLEEPESRVCVQCYLILTQHQQQCSASAPIYDEQEQVEGAVGTSGASPTHVETARSPNPNNPLEYCSTIPPHRQVSAMLVPPPSVIVPVGVLKKDAGSSYSSNSSNSSGKPARKRKSVMFSDGIAPGSDLATMEHQWAEPKQARRLAAAGAQQAAEKQRSSNVAQNKPPTPAARAESISDATTMGLVAQLFRGAIPPTAAAATVSVVQQGAATACANNSSKRQTAAVVAANAGVNTGAISKSNQAAAARSKKLPPSGCDEHGCFLTKDEHALPPIVLNKDAHGTNFEYKEVQNNFELLERLQRETLQFAVQKNLFVYVKIVNLKCCMNRTVINFTSSGMHNVGNDEIVILLEYEPPKTKTEMTELPIPKDIFVHLYEIYREAEQGNPIAELSYTSPRQSSFIGSREYGGFIFIRATFQCMQDVILPDTPFLIGILIHRNEVPWAKVFPLRLMLRLGAQYRYYPCPHISMRKRESVYAEIAQTIINFLADFRNYSYTLPCIRGMYIHMEDRQTTVLIPRMRLDDVIKAINNSSDHILAFGGNFSKTADGHLVCMQNVNDDRTEMYSYSTQAINIQGQPRKVTGASFFVLNEALKSTSGLSGKCSIVEDGLMVQILPTKMEEVRNALRNQKDIDIVCGPLNADEQHTEIVRIKWVENYRDFNVGVKSPIDEKSMEGVSGMRIHASFNYSNANYAIRLTDIFILQFEEWYNGAQNAHANHTMNITRIAEQIARSASMALVPFLDLLAASGSLKLGLRITLHQDNVCYEAGARGAKLPPLYMNALDNHLIATLHSESSGIENSIVLELIFHILNV